MNIMIEVIGWTGAVLYLGSYLALVTGRLPGTSAVYHLAQALGGLCYVLNSGHHGAWPSAGLSVVWAALGIWGTIAALRRDRPSTGQASQ